MKSLNKIHKTLIGLGCLLFLFFVARLTGVLQYYSIPTSSNEPTIEAGSTVWGTNLISPKRLDFVFFECTVNGHSEIWIKRLCGLPGETIEIKNGIFYADGKDYDQVLTLNRSYFGIGESAIDFAKRKKLEAGVDYFETPFSDTIHFYQTESQVKNENEIFRSADFGSSLEIELFWNKAWTSDNFGPVTIPENQYFVLGDNRNASMDSRYIGFIDMDRIVGVAF